MFIPNLVSVADLYQLIGAPECPVILDVRIAEDFDDDPRIIPGALRRDFDDIDALFAEFSAMRLVIYCQKGLKISQGTAALLRARGMRAQCLEGGQFAWRAAGLPMITASSIPRASNESPTIWVTCHRPHIDGIACSWLIRRFIDPQAQVLFVEPAQVMHVAERFDATPFAVENAKCAHQGDFCRFDAILEAFGLMSSAPLNIMAKIVRGADAGRLDLAPEAAGMLALSVGLSRLHADDLERLDVGMLVYDALYRWARDGK